MYDPILKSILFKIPPETAHHLTLKSLYCAHYLGLTKFFPKVFSPVTLMGIQFPNRIGLAAGLDKNGDYIEPLAALGFGFIEIGSITPKAQAGNQQPRLFRLPKKEALINRMGFNNHGLDYVEKKIKRLTFQGVLGINIGKNKDTPLENAVDDYLQGFRRMAPYASYITINISSPNTAGLRDLQQADALQNLLRTLKQAQAEFKKYVPLVVKVAPDLSFEEIETIAAILIAEKIDGLIATNTTVDHQGVKDLPYGNEVGGLSGQPLFARSTEIVRQFHQIIQNKIPIIACGGILSPADAMQKYVAGASLVQIYTGLIYRGPSLISEIASLSV